MRLTIGGSLRSQSIGLLRYLRKHKSGRLKQDMLGNCGYCMLFEQIRRNDVHVVVESLIIPAGVVQDGMRTGRHPLTVEIIAKDTCYRTLSWCAIVAIASRR